MNKKKKIILATTLTFIPVTAVVASSLAITISNNKSNLNQNLDSSNAVGNDLISGLNSNNGQNNSGKIDGWLYEGDFYSDFNDIVKKYYEINDSIKSDIYIGDFNKAYNYQNKQLKMEYLRPYDSKKILPVYKKLSGEKTIDFDEAKRSYKYGSIAYIKYTDFNGNIFDNKTDAKESMKSEKVATPILFYTLPDGTKLNPLNSIDLNKFKEKIYNEIYDYLSGEKSKLDSNISISLYDEQTDSKKNNVLSSKYSNSFFNKDNIVENIIKDLIKSIYNIQLNYILNNLKLDVKLLVRNIVKKDNEITFRSYDKTIYQLNEYVFNKDSGFPTPIENTVKRSYKTGYDKKAMDEALDKYPLDLSEAGNYYSDHSSNGDSVRLNYLEGHADDIYKWGYDFDTYITFPDVKISELNQFDTFLSYDNLFKSSYCTVDERTTQVGPGTGSGNIAQVIRINNFRGASFNLKLFFPNGCYSTAFSDAKGTDFKIFGFGTHSKGLENFDLTATFDVIVSKAKSSKVTKNDMINYIENKLSEKYMLSYDDNSNEKIINNFLFEQIKDLIWSLFKNNPDYFWNNISKFLNDDNFSLLYTPSDPQFKMVELKVNEDENFSLKPNFALLNAENTLWFNFKKTNNFLKFGKVSSPDSKDANELLDGITINYDNICNTKIDNSTNSTLNSLLGLKKLKLVIEYNNNPLFMINNTNLNLVDTNNKYLNKEFKNFIKENFFPNSVPKKEDLDKMVNVSQNFNSNSFSSSSGLQLDGKVNYYNTFNTTTTSRIEKVGSKLEFDYKTDGTDIFSEGILPPLNNVYDPENNNLDKFKINYITNVYNEIVDNKHSNIQDLVDPKDIIFLFNRYDGKRISGSNLKYRRFLGQDDNDNPSLFDNTSIELYNNKVDLEWAIENKLSLEPGMIIVLKDTDGNILNPGFDVSSESELEWIKSDSVFGTESIIRDNYIRTKIIRPLQNQVYYQESEDAEYSEDNFISNKIERVFSFSVPDKNLDSNNSSSTGATITYYYLSYEDCYNNFLSYLRTLCTPVTIKS